MNLNDTDFELFDVPPTFAQDRDAIDARWKALQREAHPDRFAAQGAAAQRIAMQWSVRINEAYQRLKNPIKRATYLCQLNGFPIQAETNTAMPADFLMQQMAWREGLDEAVTTKAVEAIAADIDTHRCAAYAELAGSIDKDGDFEAAGQQVRALMFVERFAADVDERLAAREV